MKAKYGFKTNNDVENFLKKNNLVLHHSAKKTMQLVDAKLHNAVRHTGAASEMTNGK